MSERRKTDFLISSTAWLFVIGFFFQFPVTRDDGVSLPAHLYQMADALLFLFAGIGMIKRKHFGYTLLMLLTALSTIETFFDMLRSDQSDILKALSSYVPQAQFLDARMLRQFAVAMHMLTLLGYWGFAYYVHRRKDYFEAPAVHPL